MRERDVWFFKIPFLHLLLIAFWILAYCRPSSISLHPIPSKIDRIEGYASISITGAQGSGRSKFFFLFQLPRQGRIEVSNFLGRTLYQIIINGERAVFFLPSKRVYWQGKEEEIINFFLGFYLNLDEMLSLIRGEWETKEKDIKDREDLENWNLRRDEKSRVVAGQRGELRFEVREFLAGSSFPRILYFYHPLNKGRLKVLRLGLNRPLKKSGAFSLSFLEDYRQVSWDEIEKILSNEN